ncbi:MAG: thiamine pyrophosphate-dependent dehydrogenase E1 component subunit alpha [Bacteroidia bacterium]
MFNAFTEKVLPLEDLPVPYLPGWEEAVAYWPEIETALRIRATEERLLQLFGEGKLYGTVHTCIGQEWSAVAVGRALQPQDYVFSNHRCHGHFLAYGGSVQGLIAEVMGKRDGVCGGRGGSQHLCYNRFFSNGIQGGIAPVTAGLAWARQMEGNGGIAVVFLGDGTLGQGVLYETLNIASKWSLPILFVVENNRYAQSTASGETLSGQIAHRFEAFGIAGNEGNTWEWPGLLDGMARSVEAVREHGKPRFHIVDTYRLKPHSKGDDFRSPDEIKRYVSVDPLMVMQEAYAENAEWKALTSRIKAEVDAAVAFAEASPISEDGPVELEANAIRWIPAPKPSDKPRMNLAIQQALGRELEENARAVFFGRTSRVLMAARSRSREI